MDYQVNAIPSRLVSKSAVLPVLLFLSLGVMVAEVRAQSCTINQVSSRTGTAINIELDTGCSSEAQITMGAAALYWADFLYSPADINISANFEPLHCTSSSAVLGSAGAAYILRDFPNAPYPGTWYSAALANAVVGYDLYPANPDINMQFNNAIGTTGCLDSRFWFYDDGTEPDVPASAIDLFGVVQHELGHGLGFASAYSSAGSKTSGYDDIYSNFLFDEVSGRYLSVMGTDGERAGAMISTGNLTWRGGAVQSASGRLTAGTTNGHTRMYAPNPYEPGSSVSHFDTALTPSDLMEPIKVARSQTSIVLTKNLLRDLGWKTLPDPPEIVSTIPGATTVTFELAAPSQDGGSVILNYTVNCDGIEVTQAGTSVVVAGLESDTEYQCRAYTNTAIGSSDAEVAVVTTETGVPSRPEITRVEAGDESISLLVLVGDDGGSPVLEVIATCTDGTSTFTGSSSTAGVTVYGLTNGLAYTCSVVVRNANGDSQTSLSTQPVVPEYVARGLPVWLLKEASSPANP